MKKISFIILTYNSESYIQECIESLLRIKKFKIEIFIIDNGSNDKTINILEKYSKNNSNIEIIKLERNYGTTYSRNLAFHKIKNTDYICILDSDTIVNEDAFEKMSSFLDKNKDVGLVGPAMQNKNGERQVPYRKLPNWKIKLLKACPIKSISKKGEKMESYGKIDYSKPFESDYLISACWLMPYNTYKKVGDFDEKIFYAPEDVDYCIRVWKNNMKVYHIPNAEIIHLYQRISKKKIISKTNLSHIQGLNYLFKKHKKYLKEYRKGNK